MRENEDNNKKTSDLYKNKEKKYLKIKTYN